MAYDTQAAILQQRIAIDTAELQRALPMPRPSSWDGARWEQDLALLIDAERRRDAELQVEIDQAAYAREVQVGWEEWFAGEIEVGIAWLQDLDRRLYDLELMWGGFDPGDGRIAELTRHRWIVHGLLLARLVRRAEVALERCEYQRHAAGWLADGQWEQAWGSVQTAWAEQDASLEQTFGNRQMVNDERRFWLQRLYAYQLATLGTMGTGSVGASALRLHMGVVDDATKRYLPAPGVAAQQSGDGGWLAVLFVAVLIIAGIALAGGRAQGGGQPAPLVPITDDQDSAVPIEAAQPTLAALIPAAQAADLIVQGQELRRAGRCDEAAPIFEQAIATDPVMLDSYSALAFCLFDLGRVDEAIRRWDEALLHSPQDPEALAGLGMAHYVQGATDAGTARFREAVAIDPRFLDEGFLRGERGWSDGAIAASRPLREAIAP